MKRDARGLVDTRRWRRSTLAATALLCGEGVAPAGPFPVQNLSAGGALLLGGGELAVGSRVRIELRIPGRRPVHVAGTVVRTEPAAGGAGAHAAVAVAFLDVASDVEDLIQQAVLDALERARRQSGPAVLLMDASLDRRVRLERDLGALGRVSLHARTPLEALRWLHDPQACVETALVDLAFGRASGPEVLVFLAEHFPALRRVLVSRAADAAQLEAARSAGSAHAILVDPWDRRRLRDALAAGVTPP